MVGILYIIVISLCIGRLMYVCYNFFWFLGEGDEWVRDSDWLVDNRGWGFRLDLYLYIDG